MAKLQGSSSKARIRPLMAVKAGKTVAGQKVLKLNKVARTTAPISGGRRAAKIAPAPAAAPVVLWDEMGAGRRHGLARR